MDEGKWLVVCDVDGTLYMPEAGNPGLAEFAEFIDARRDRIVFALNSGRSLDEMAEVAEGGPLPRPDWLVCSVGTEIFADFDPSRPDPEWAEFVMREWPRDELREALASLDFLEEQEAWLQHHAKLSYYIDSGMDSLRDELDRVTAPWAGRFKTTLCLDRYLDFLPPWGGKGGPVEFLARRLGIPRNRIVTAGDSGNDRDMLDRGFHSILVANHAAEIGDLASLPTVLRAESPAAAGVLEGLRRLGLD